jgi:hypothetical protein
LDEGREAVFQHDLVLRPHLQGGVERVARGARLEAGDALLHQLGAAHGEPVGPFREACLVGRVLDPEHLPARLAECGGQSVDVGHGLNRRPDRHSGVRGHHEAVLQIDHDQRRPARVHVVVHVQLAAALQHAVDGPLRHGAVVHRGTPLQGEARAASPWSPRRSVWRQAVSCPSPTSTTGGMAVRQAAVANMQRGVKLATVYSTFRGTFQKTHTTRGRATIVGRTVTTPPDNAPGSCSIDVQVCFWKSRQPVEVPSRFLHSSTQTALTPLRDAWQNTPVLSRPRSSARQTP